MMSTYMPDSYQGQDASERERFRHALEADARNWAEVTGRWVEVELVDYVHADQYKFDLHIAGYGPLGFTSTEDAIRFIDAMWPSND